MEGVYVILPLIAALLCPSQAALRDKRQYSPDQIDPVTGALIGECTFYGDQTVDCTGRLRCHASDVQDRSTLAGLDRLCPREPSQKSGTWDRDQVIPASMMRNAGTGRVAKCQFYANHGSGQFTCTGVQGDSWKGKYTGTLNTAFKLGLPLGQSTYPAGSVYNTDRGNPSYPAGSVYGSGAVPSYPAAGSVYADRDQYNNVNTGRDSDYYATTSRYGSGAPYGSRDRDNYDGGRYATGLGLNDRDPTYRDTSINAPRDRYQTSYRGNSDTVDSRNPSRATTSQITMCTYSNDGTGICRDCTERVERSETDRAIRTTKHYTCSGPETRTTWSEGNGVMQAGQRPERYSSSKRIVATCIFRPDERTFDCHGGSNDGNCGLGTSDAYGATGAGGDSLSRCLTGEKWTGTYRGSIYQN